MNFKSPHNILQGYPFLVLLCFSFFFSFTSCSDDDDAKTPLEEELDLIRTASEAFDTFEEAQSMGYLSDVTGYRTGMGHHFLNTDLVDNTIEIDKPEVVLYAPDENGVMQFMAVEYAVPIEDINNPPPAPEGFTGDGDVWAINTEFNLWTLHCWMEIENENGIFAPTNPKLP